MRMSSKSDYIGNVKVHSQCADSLSLRTNVRKFVSSLDLRPSGLSPSSILLIKRMVSTFPDQMLSGVMKNEWRHAIFSKLAQLYKTAKRPAHGRLSARHDVVLFSDKSELLACYCLDYARGELFRKWWWEKYFSNTYTGLSSQEFVVAKVVENSRFVPAMIALLSGWRQAVRFVNKLDITSCDTIIKAVLVEYHFHDLQVALYENLDEIISHERAAYINKRESTDKESPRAAIQISRPPPWLNLFADEVWQPEFSKEHTLFLGVCRILYKAPQVLRTRSFCKQIIKWWRQSADTKHVFLPNIKHQLHHGADNNIHMPTDKSLQRSDDEFSKKYQDKYKAVSEPDSTVVDDGETFPQESAASNLCRLNESIIRDHHADRNINNDGIIAENSQLLEWKTKGSDIKMADAYKYDDAGYFDDACDDYVITEMRPNDDVKKNMDGVTGDSRSVAEDLADVTPGTDEDRLLNEFNIWRADRFIDTELSGVMYLINLLRQLDVPNCFPGQCDLDQKISRWELLDGLARALLGGSYINYSHDPVWRILTELDGRRFDDKIGYDIGVDFSENYFMPKKWFEFFYDQNIHEFYWAKNKDKLCIWTDFGVIVNSRISAKGDVRQSAIEYLEEYSNNIPSARIISRDYANAPIVDYEQLLRSGIGIRYAQLLSFILCPVYFYLQYILSLDEITPDILLDKLLLCDGRIYLGSSHVDLEVDIDSSSLSVRHSGLDQDPGWLPEFGRVVLFHFV